MFEDFSFTTPSTRPSRLALDADDRRMLDSDSNLISPLSSRCPSPSSQRFRNISGPRSTHFHRNQPPTSVPFPYEDHHKRLSISTLTQKLHEHTLTSSTETHTPRPQHAFPDGHGLPHSHAHTRRRYPGYVLTPPDTDHSDDSGVECLSSRSASSTTSPTFLPPDLLSDLPELSLNANANANANQNASVGLGLPFNPSHSQAYQNIRLQRQQISQLQCNQLEVEAMQRSVMDETVDFDCPRDEDDCHPSSLPPRASPRRRALTLARSRFGPEGHGHGSGNGNPEGRGRRKSSVGAVLSSRVEKSHFGGKRGSRGLG
ncbi:hypothetical protein N7535_006986 [Penicillium sp. DV-2018c]|nr:hypothetical protein N7461_006924 [Penicillium sp. DV-2018c]KAJ5567680.1 hypothetical protein N7535_006986 [Penicillium sp. DV-2018c]